MSTKDSGEEIMLLIFISPTGERTCILKFSLCSYHAVIFKLWEIGKKEVKFAASSRKNDVRHQVKYSALLLI